MEPAMRALCNVRLAGQQTVLIRRVYGSIKDLLDLSRDWLAALGAIHLCFRHNSLFLGFFFAKCEEIMSQFDDLVSLV